MVWLWLTGCLEHEIRERRQWEMQDHEADFFAALDALRARDLARTKTAGQGLARKDALPGVPPDTARSIEAVRAAGQRVAEAEDLPAATRALSTVSEHCSACHRAIGVTSPAPVDGSNPANEAWMAVLFEDEVRWAHAMPGGGPASWGERRSVLVAQLP